MSFILDRDLELDPPSLLLRELLDLNPPLPLFICLQNTDRGLQSNQLKHAHLSQMLHEGPVVVPARFHLQPQLESSPPSNVRRQVKDIRILDLEEQRDLIYGSCHDDGAEAVTPSFERSSPIELDVAAHLKGVASHLDF